MCTYVYVYIQAHNFVDIIHCIYNWLLFFQHFCNEMFSSLLHNKLDVSGGWLRCIQCVWIWLTAFKALSMLFVLMTSLSLSAVVSCHTCSTSSRLCVLARFRFTCVCVCSHQCVFAALVGNAFSLPLTAKLSGARSHAHTNSNTHTLTHTLSLLTGEIVWRAFKAISALSRSFSSIHTLH